MERNDFMQFGFVMSLLFAVIIAIFAVLNSDVVTIQLIFKKVELSQSVIILGSAAIGAIIAVFFGVFSKVKSSLKIRELKGEIKELETSLEKIQNENQALLESISQNTAEVKNDEVLEKNTEKVCEETK